MQRTAHVPALSVTLMILVGLTMCLARAVALGNLLAFPHRLLKTMSAEILVIGVARQTITGSIVVAAKSLLPVMLVSDGVG
jgi:hypothetical protein